MLMLLLFSLAQRCVAGFVYYTGTNMLFHPFLSALSNVWMDVCLEGADPTSRCGISPSSDLHTNQQTFSFPITSMPVGPLYIHSNLPRVLGWTQRSTTFTKHELWAWKIRWQLFQNGKVKVRYQTVENDAAPLQVKCFPFRSHRVLINEQAALCSSLYCYVQSDLSLL